MYAQEYVNLSKRVLAFFLSPGARWLHKIGPTNAKLVRSLHLWYLDRPAINYKGILEDIARLPPHVTRLAVLEHPSMQPSRTLHINRFTDLFAGNKVGETPLPNLRGIVIQQGQELHPPGGCWEAFNPESLELCSTMARCRVDVVSYDCAKPTAFFHPDVWGAKVLATAAFCPSGSQDLVG